MTRLNRFISVAAVLAAGSTPLSAQIVVAPQPGRYGVSVEAMRPELKAIDGITDSNGATMFLSGHAELKPGARLQIEIPFVYSKLTENGASESSSSIGNPYLGLQLQKKWLTVNVGGRAPLASTGEFAPFVGMVTDLDRFEAFIPDMGTLTGVARVEGITSAGFAVAGFGGPAYMIYTGDETDVDNETTVIYGVEASYRATRVHAGARLSGRYIATEDGSFNERSTHQVGLFASLGSGSIRPTLQFRIPIDDDLSDEMKWSGGVGLHIELGKR